MAKKITRHPKFLKPIGKLAAQYIRFVRNHSDFHVLPDNPDQFIIQHNPFILSVWHGQFFLIPTIRPEPIKAKIVVGRHGDAEIADIIVKHFGVETIRGSGAAGRRGAHRGGLGVIRQALSALRKGYCIVSTADVPPGPAQEVGLGIITMAKFSGRPIVPAAITTRAALHFGNWSRFSLNLPFTKGGFVMGDPIHVPRHADEEEMNEARQRLQLAMEQVTHKAYQLAEGNEAPIFPLRKRSLEPGFLLKAYQTGTRLLQPFAPQILKWRDRKGKEDLERADERMGKSSISRPHGQLIWFHAVSVGETMAILPLIQQLSESKTAPSILLTTGTKTSARLAAERLPENAFHQYIPLDSPEFIRSFLDHWQPELAIFVESEIWPNLILEASAKKIPMMLINGRISKKSYKSWFKRPTLARPIFGRFDKILAQNDLEARRFRALGAENVIISGNIKIDAPALPIDDEKYSQISASIGSRPIFLAASTHDGEDGLIANAHQILSQDISELLTIIVPRHPERRDKICQMLEEKKLSYTLASKNELPGHDTAIHIGDTIGDLGLYYKLADLAFMGGSMINHGGQNPLEALHYDTALLFGPYWYNFHDIYYEILRNDGAIEVKNESELIDKARTCLLDPDKCTTMVTNAKDALENLSGGLAMTHQVIAHYIQSGEQSDASLKIDNEDATSLPESQTDSQSSKQSDPGHKSSSKKEMANKIELKHAK